MIKLQGTLPRTVYLACSGGVDSMAILDFLKKNHSVTIAYFNHGSEHDHRAEQFIKAYCEQNQLELVIGRLTKEKHPEQSTEEFWRTERYKFLHQLPGTVITGHHLDDCVETWIWSSLHGQGKTIPYKYKNVVRPFRLTKKSELKNWAAKKSVSWVEDESNTNQQYTRNFIRHTLMPNALVVNPGLHKTIKKKMSKETV